VQQSCRKLPLSATFCNELAQISAKLPLSATKKRKMFTFEFRKRFWRKVLKVTQAGDSLDSCRFASSGFQFYAVLRFTIFGVKSSKFYVLRKSSKYVLRNLQKVQRLRFSAKVASNVLHRIHATTRGQPPAARVTDRHQDSQIVTADSTDSYRSDCCGLSFCGCWQVSQVHVFPRFTPLVPNATRSHRYPCPA
jgi:hypothetical protein